MKGKKVLICLLAAMIMLVSQAWATYQADISYDFLNNGGGNYTFTFKVSNTSTGGDNGPLDFFMINFDADPDYSNYTNITWMNDKGWASGVYDYDPAFGLLPANIFGDDSILGSGGGGIAQGSSLAGFKVSFDYAGALAPASQLFSWYAEFGTNLDGRGDDLGGYWILGSADGSMRYEPACTDPSCQVVPEPSTIVLIGAGLAGLLAAKKRKLF